LAVHLPGQIPPALSESIWALYSTRSAKLGSIDALQRDEGGVAPWSGRVKIRESSFPIFTIDAKSFGHRRVQLGFGGRPKGHHLAGHGIGDFLDVLAIFHSAPFLSSLPGQSPSRMVSAALTALPRAVWKSAPFCAIQPAM